LSVVVNTERVNLRDQAPLYEKKIRLHDGWSFEKFVEHLNRHVFFWSGWETGPIDYGARYFQTELSNSSPNLQISSQRSPKEATGLQTRSSVEAMSISLRLRARTATPCRKNWRGKSKFDLENDLASCHAEQLPSQRLENIRAIITTV
jgi:hypothetical protein